MRSSNPGIAIFLLCLLSGALLPSALGEEVKFHAYFEDKALRVDLHQFGNHETETFAIDELIEQPIYAGPRDGLIDPCGFGSCRFDLYDAATETRIFSRGFCTLFGEWRTTPEAIDGVQRVFEHTLIMPYPREDVILTISRRKGMNPYQEIFRQKIEMNPKWIRADNPCKDCKPVKILYKGDPSEKVDLVILGDGYTAQEMKKYIKDARRIADELMSLSPLKENHRKFNVWAVESPSPESGVDEPRKGDYKATRFEVAFNAFDLGHYPLTFNVKRIHDVAACVPCDYVLIVYNSPRYGGGGLYNLYAIVPGRLPGVVAHEFGHLFAGLADEYFNSPVTYVDLYPDGLEPWEPNITALLHPEEPKWGALIKKGTPIPTPNDAKYFGDVGCFEGAGYKTEGLYRPCHNCIMLSCRGGFCPVCAEAIVKAIEFHSK